MVTHQTGPSGKVVYRLYVEQATDIEKEIYLALFLIEISNGLYLLHLQKVVWKLKKLLQLNLNQYTLEVEPAVGLRDFQARELAFALRHSTRTN